MIWVYWDNHSAAPGSSLADMVSLSLCKLSRQCLHAGNAGLLQLVPQHTSAAAGCEVTQGQVLQESRAELTWSWHETCDKDKSDSWIQAITIRCGEAEFTTKTATYVLEKEGNATVSSRLYQEVRKSYTETRTSPNPKR